MEGEAVGTAVVIPADIARSEIQVVSVDIGTSIWCTKPVDATGAAIVQRARLGVARADKFERLGEKLEIFIGGVGDGVVIISTITPHYHLLQYRLT